MARHRRLDPEDVYQSLPCSVVAVGTALGLGNSDGAAISALVSPELKRDGYLSLDGMNRLIRANMAVRRRVNFRRTERPILHDYMDEHPGQAAIICVEGHFLYSDGTDYYSFLPNRYDRVVCAWEIG